MAGSKTEYLAQKMLDHALGGSTYTQPSKVYVALSTAAFSTSATGSSMNEVSAGDYARIELDNDSTVFTGATADSPSEKHNKNDIEWNEALNDWGTPKSVYLADASTGGNLLYGADISNATAVNTNDKAKILKETLVFNES